MAKGAQFSIRIPKISQSNHPITGLLYNDGKDILYTEVSLSYTEYSKSQESPP